MTDGRAFRWKQCIVIRTDITMSCGKKCAQAGHAAISAFLRAGRQAQDQWLADGQMKVVLKGRDGRILHELKALAEAADIPAALITDAGLTEIPPGTVTALGLGPARIEEIDRLTGDLPLL
ncbi:MAG: peptidyl-tRNA hydrolase Pth2 [Methanoculleaceae archaeon]